MNSKFSSDENNGETTTTETGNTNATEVDKSKQFSDAGEFSEHGTKTQTVSECEEESNKLDSTNEDIQIAIKNGANAYTPASKKHISEEENIAFQNQTVADKTETDTEKPERENDQNSFNKRKKTINSGKRDHVVSDSDSDYDVPLAKSMKVREKIRKSLFSSHRNDAMSHQSKISDSDSDYDLPLAKTFTKKNKKHSEKQQLNLQDSESGLSDDSAKDPNFKLEK
ncbi:uncharacterized protein LOC130047188 [Ostrea edulis]|uniref:uncharacterized protein LOC130047188 n=1 Tax=Ostrea edulis TaxID=37623 RepID=UPI0024AF888F|nr:uncharacterized protein LOC130047188 [Ostrea edulis]